MLSKEQKMKSLEEKAKRCNISNHKIATEIYALSEFLYCSNRNLWSYQREYLMSKLFDLIHSYLLNLDIIYESWYNQTGHEHSDWDVVKENLNNCDYSIQSNRKLIYSLEITTKENVEYWYEIPSSKKTLKIDEIGQ